MTTLWFRHLRSQDRIGCRETARDSRAARDQPPALGELDASYLTRLREIGGLESYPNRTKDRTPWTTRSGRSASAPARRATEHAFGGAGAGRQYSLLGDAEFDECAVWEAILDPAMAELAEIVWVVDLNRQSLGRVVPHLTADRLRGMFSPALRRRGAAQAAVGEGSDSRGRRADRRAGRGRPYRPRSPASDGHDLGALDRAFAAIDDSRTHVISAYTVKGHGLPTQGLPQNHASR
uniref:hypothetical protein n=1 Tax=Nonomuraea bangladeshensis TaxID=404385 RepID=UPI003F498668